VRIPQKRSSTFPIKLPRSTGSIATHFQSHLELLLILLRLSDAMAEVRDVRGLQIHRSHWVATHAVDRIERLSDGRLRVHLVNGLTLPVSRTFVRAVREAGLGKEINGS
jgi:DNA-binding LytR/AlgR family response regulator